MNKKKRRRRTQKKKMGVNRPCPDGGVKKNTLLQPSTGYEHIKSVLVGFPLPILSNFPQAYAVSE